MHTNDVEEDAIGMSENKMGYLRREDAVSKYSRLGKFKVMCPLS